MPGRMALRMTFKEEYPEELLLGKGSDAPLGFQCVVLSGIQLGTCLVAGELE